MNIVSVGKNISKYMARQSEDIAKFGEKTVTRTSDVKEEVLAVFTPFRRLSKKPCVLSDNKYFIDKFEKTTQIDLPKQDMWESLSEEEKIDYIVKGRYKKLLANKIMNAIKDQPVEHNFMLSENGEILAHNVGDTGSVNIKNALKLQEDLYEKRIKLEQKKNHKFAHIDAECATTTVHNHPKYYDEVLADHCDTSLLEIFKKYFGLYPDTEVNAISIKDIMLSAENVMDGFVVDSLGHKFHFAPKPHNIKTVEDYENYAYFLNKFEYLAKGINHKLKTLYEEEKENLENMITRGISNTECIQEQRMYLLQTYVDWLRELISQKGYRKFLQSDFVRENIGYFKELA